MAISSSYVCFVCLFLSLSVLPKGDGCRRDMPQREYGDGMRGECGALWCGVVRYGVVWREEREDGWKGLWN